MIEQAKGILVARDGISLDEAFVRLRHLSQEHNVRLVEVAATIVGVAVPVGDGLATELDDRVLTSQLPAAAAPSTTWRALQNQPEIREGLLHALLDTVSSSKSEGDEAAQLLFDLLSGLDLTGLALYRTVLDGSLRAIGNVGLEPDAASAWRTIPLSYQLPLTRAVVERQAFFLEDSSARQDQYPAIDARVHASAAIPVFDDGHVSGGVLLTWGTAQAFDPERREAITRSVQRIAGLVIRNASESDLDLEWLRLLLGLHLDPWILLDTIAGVDSQVRHLIVQDVSDRLPGVDWLGRRLLEVWPATATDGSWDGLSTLVRTGGRWTMQVGSVSQTPWGVPGTEVRAVRLGSRVVMVWRSPGT